MMASASAIAIQEELRELYVDSGDELILTLLTIDPERHPDYVRGGPARRAQTVRTQLLRTLFADERFAGYAVVLSSTLNEAFVVSCRAQAGIGAAAAARELAAMRRDLDAVWAQVRARGPLTPDDSNTSSALEAYITRAADLMRTTRGIVPR